MAGVHFPKTHDMETLGDLAVAHYPAWQPTLAGTFRLTDWAWVYRYPGVEDEADPSPSDLSQALATIEQLTVCLASLVQPGDRSSAEDNT
jgi:hypothetical protein